jgi:predicted transposase YbfD/YdcC
MDQGQYSNLAALLADIPDPRRARGQRHPWALILTLVGLALASGARGMGAAVRWVGERREELARELQPPRGALPSASTLRRAVRAVDCTALEARVAAFVAGLPAPADAAPARWRGLAIDGKAVRGANAHGAACHLVSVVRHADGYVLQQAAVGAKTNEITAVPALLAGRDLVGCVVTMDALLAQRALARQIVAQGGHYLVVVKANQPTLYEALAEAFAGGYPIWPGDHRARCRTVSKGHGRLETRTLERTAALNDCLPWPRVGQVLRRTYHAVLLKSGAVRHEVTYGLTSLPAAETAPAEVEQLWRGHWTIENRVHYIRDVTFGEDAGQVRAGSAPQALAALRNALLSLLRALGWQSIANALAHYGAYLHRALNLLHHHPARL